ncbi:DMT family transporter [Caldalkalibacillus salinus]|uniref:DMT family transporter n=1 Tax=Caldalkalibacillus salinus TaxID=2803787 RepID=UPI00192222B7|nr:multidrug efflux SMR transporter [Caldalkalibacillus salinus]
MAWVALFVAGLFEILFVTFLKLSQGFKRWGATLAMSVAGALSFYLLSYALQFLPLGTAYAIWTAIGAVGSVAVGILWFKDAFNQKMLFFIFCIVIGVIGLKLTT